MNLKRLLFLLAVLPSLLLAGCGGKDPINELPPPDNNNENNGGGNNGNGNGNGNGGGSTTNPWDANRGKVVTPSGAGWTSKTIDDGLVYYTYVGVDEFSKLKQEIFVVDLDLSKTQYKVQLLHTSPAVPVPDAFKLIEGTVAAMNANYELNSIYVRTAGTNHYQIPKSTISSNGKEIPNWKSEAAFTSDGERGLSIVFAGSPKRDGRITGIKDKTYDQAVGLQRNFYYRELPARTYPYLISSAPMLIDDFEPVGENFCDYSLTLSQAKALNGEDPNHHQRVEHPRSAVALTENNHFIMFVVDGRTNYSNGMSCRDLTRFMVKWFNPQYALNMDGGGSSTLCVKGEGDPDSHVVNYPCQNIPNKNSHDHTHLRNRDFHFVILKKQQ